MFLYFNSNGQLLERLEHGPQARAGTTNFEIFAYFEDLDIDTCFNAATLTLIKPDLEHTSYPPLIMEKKTIEFVNLNGEHSEKFENNHNYRGYYFNFYSYADNQTVDVLIDTIGTWIASIRLYSINRNIFVQGNANFTVSGGIESEDNTTVNDDTLLSNFFLALAKKIDIDSNGYLKVVENFPAIGESFDEDIFAVGNILFNKADDNFYALDSLVVSLSNPRKIYSLGEFLLRKDAIIKGINLAAFGDLTQYTVGQALYVCNSSEAKLYEVDSNYQAHLVVDLLDKYSKSSINTLLSGKVDKSNTSYRVYTTDGLVQYGTSALAANIVQRDRYGDIYGNNEPQSNAALVNKYYTDNKFFEKNNVQTSSGSEGDNKVYSSLYVKNQLDNKLNRFPSSYHMCVYARDSEGSDFELDYDSAVRANTLALRDANGHVRTENPSGDYDAANKQYVDNAINTYAAYYITKNAAGDAFATRSELMSASTFYSGGVVRTPTRNDYCYVLADENHDNATTKYIYNNGWEFQIVINETPFTQAQLDAINSGATAAKINAIDEKVDQTGAGEVLYGTTITGHQTTVPYGIAATAGAVAKRDSNGNIRVGTATNVDDATSKTYVDSGLATKFDASNVLTSAGNETNSTVYSALYVKNELEDKLDRKLGTYTVYSVNGSNQQVMLGYNANNLPDTLVQRDANGCVRFSTPTVNEHGANKGYVDGNFVAKTSVKTTRSTTSGQIYDVTYVNAQLNEINEKASGLCRNFATVLDFQVSDIEDAINADTKVHWYYSEGGYWKYFDDVSEFTSWRTGKSIGSGNSLNSRINDITFSDIMYTNAMYWLFIDANEEYYLVTLNDYDKLFKANDNILIPDTGCADRWVFGSHLYALETAKLGYHALGTTSDPMPFISTQTLSGTTVSVTLDSLSNFKCSSALTSLTIISLSVDTNDDAPSWQIQFVADTGFTVTLPVGCTWKYGTPTFNVGEEYTIIIEKRINNDYYAYLL